MSVNSTLAPTGSLNLDIIVPSSDTGYPSLPIFNNNKNNDIVNRTDIKANDFFLFFITIAKVLT